MLFEIIFFKHYIMLVSLRFDFDQKLLIFRILIICVQKQFTAIILVTSNWLIIAGTQLAEKTQESLILLTTCQVVYDILDDLHVDLFIQKWSIVS